MADVKKEEEIKKAIDGLVDAALTASTETEKKEETVEKASPGDSAEQRGGEDKLKSGSPATSSNSAKVEKADDAAKPEAKKEDSSEDEKDPKKKKKDDKKDDKKPAFLKKSVEELADILTEDEVELIKAWREENGEIEVEEVEAPVQQVNVEEITKSVRESISAEISTLTKSLSEKDALIKGLSDQVATLSKQPAYDKRSLATLEPIEKAAEEATISKSQVLNKMLELQMAGKGVRSQHVAEFESTENISDPGIKALVMNSFKS